MRRQFPSILSPALKWFFYIVLILAAFMLANTLYLLIYRLAEILDLGLFAIGETSLPKLFQFMVLTHTGVGILLTIVLLSFVIAHLPKVWRRNHRSSIISGILYVFISLLLFITGFFILTEAASRDNQWAWWLHVMSGLLVVIGHLVHRLVSYTRPHKSNIIKYFTATLIITVLIMLGHVFDSRNIVLTKEAQSALRQDLNKGPGSGENRISMSNKNSFIPPGFVEPASPFFPSAVTTKTGGFLPLRIITGNDTGNVRQLKEDISQIDFAQRTAIGSETCNRCHQDIVTQWETSAHRFASFNNPFYEASILDLRNNHKDSNRWVDEHIKLSPKSGNQAGMIKSKFCGACHDPAILLTGKMDDVIDRNRPEAQAGLTCLACHTIDKIHNPTGNGNYNIADQQEDPYLFADADSGSLGAFLHDAAMKAKPEVHKRRMQKPFFSTAEYCASCHKVSISEQINNYRWLRGQNEYDNWHDSGVSQNASRTFYLPGFKRVCQDCHMPPEAAPLGDLAAINGVVKSHRFLAVNTALPFLRGDTATIKRIESFLQIGKLRVDIFAIKSAKKSYFASETIPAFTGGEKITVDVVVRNQGVGHTFPGGTTDSNEGWLELSIFDENNNLLTKSGALDENKHIDPMAHVYKILMVDKIGNEIDKRNAQDIHTTVFSNVIGPGTSDIAHYTFEIPENFSGKTLTIKTRLLWRKFNRTYTEFVYKNNPEGFKQFSDVPDLPVTEIAHDHIIMQISPVKDEAVTEIMKANTTPQWMRYNDYGIGLLLEGDTRGARAAFEKVEILNPSSIEGSLNLAKTYIQDGNIDKAYLYLKKCEEIEAGNARVAWVWGLTLQKDGQYKKAVSAYQHVLEQFPEDRAALRNLGRTYYLNQQYNVAIKTLDKVLRIDPEDRIAYYHKMLCYQALGKNDEFEKAKAAYEFYQIDESAQEVTQAFRLKNPGANIMAQTVRTHKLTLNKE